MSDYSDLDGFDWWLLALRLIQVALFCVGYACALVEPNAFTIACVGINGAFVAFSVSR